MALWVFLLLCELLCPAALILFGRGLMTYSEKGAAEDPLHVSCGKLWQRIGWVMLPATVFAHLLLLGRAAMVVGVWSGVIMGLQTLILLISVLPAKRALLREGGF